MYIQVGIITPLGVISKATHHTFCSLCSIPQSPARARNCSKMVLRYLCYLAQKGALACYAPGNRPLGLCAKSWQIARICTIYGQLANNCMLVLMEMAHNFGHFLANCAKN